MTAWHIEWQMKDTCKHVQTPPYCCNYYGIQVLSAWKDTEKDPSEEMILLFPLSLRCLLL